MTVFSAKFLNFMIAFVNVILMIFNTSSVNKKPQTLDISDYELVFADEFDGDSLDTSKWRQHDGGGVRKGGYWTLDQARVEDGNLIITTQYKEDGQSGPGWYTAGSGRPWRPAGPDWCFSPPNSSLTGRSGSWPPSAGLLSASTGRC